MQGGHAIFACATVAADRSQPLRLYAENQLSNCMAKWKVRCWPTTAPYSSEVIPHCSGSRPQRRRNDLLRLGHHLLQVLGALEAFGVDLVDVLGA